MGNVDEMLEDDNSSHLATSIFSAAVRVSLRYLCVAQLCEEGNAIPQRSILATKCLGMKNSCDWRLCVLIIQESLRKKQNGSVSEFLRPMLLQVTKRTPKFSDICVFQDTVSPFTKPNLSNTNVQAFYQPKHGDDFSSRTK